MFMQFIQSTPWLDSIFPDPLVYYTTFVLLVELNSKYYFKTSLLEFTIYLSPALNHILLRHLAPLAVKTSLLINELTCRIGNAIWLVVIYCLSALCARVIPLVVACCVSAILYACARAHYFARYVNVTVKIRTLGSNVSVALAGSLVLRDSL